MKNLGVLMLILFLSVSKTIAKNSFYLVKSNSAATIVYMGQDEVVKNAIDMFVADTRLVAETESKKETHIKDGAIVVCNLAESDGNTEIAELLKDDISDVKGSWEMFCIKQADINGKNCLVVLGSDSRGTAYGVLELSRRLGVSPWNWWADVAPKKLVNFELDTSKPIAEKPSVKYRGVFLNDEDWALMPWSYKTHEAESSKGEIGPRTYARIFELLLRLRANTVWPAMHECTVPFYLKEGNRQMAEKYGIVVGTSHCEPMMRCSASEWVNSKYGAYNFVTNKDKVVDYWCERLDELSNSENIFTLGMRGVHDGRMQGVSTIDDETAILQNVIEEQRGLLAKYHDNKVAELPQVFVPYKEVLKAYNNGLKLPKDVTIMWCDDNQGYITRLSNSKEQQRDGGAGVYYHISYWGKPHDYLWLATTSPGLIYREMKRAWDYGAQKIWVLNVGDIKPSEYLTEFFLDLAWDIDGVKPNTIATHRENWISENFGAQLSGEISDITDDFYTLASHRKPEHTAWNRVEANKEMSGVHDSELNPFMFGDELEQRLAKYADIASKSDSVYDVISDIKKDSYFQLIHYPVLSCDAMNRKMLYAQKARLFARYNLPVANEYAKLSKAAYNEIAELTYTYNKDITRGKWDGIMDFKPRDLPVFQAPLLPKEQIIGSGSDELVVWVENDSLPLNDCSVISLPQYIKPVSESFFVSFFSQKEGQTMDWNVEDAPCYIDVEKTSNNSLMGELKLSFKYDASKYNGEKGGFNVVVAGKEYSINIDVKGVDYSGNITALEHNNMVVIDIDKPMNSCKITSIQNIGHNGKVILLPKSKNGVEYQFESNSTGDVDVRVGLTPQHACNDGSVRYSVSIDGNLPEIVTINSEFLSKKWAENTLRNQVLTVSKHKIMSVGVHRIKITSLDEDICLDQIMIDFDTDRKFYLIPEM